MTPAALVAALANVRLVNVFNPYSDICNTFDMPDAVSHRRNGLLSYLQAAVGLGVDTIWMARDLGHRGGRRTGLALTDEQHLPILAQVYPGARAVKSTLGPTVGERTATEIWAVLRQLSKPPLLWNVFPFHPHKAGNAFTNRRFTSVELRAVDQLNWALLDLLKVTRIVSIGQDAGKYAQRFGLDIVSIRHPSYGGVSEFRRGMGELYDLPGQADPKTGRQNVLL